MYSIRTSPHIPAHTRDEYAYDQLLALLSDPEFGPDTRLPAEQTLAERFGVSRPMLRQALARLRAEGRIYSRKGSGSYVGNEMTVSQALSFSTLASIPDVRSFLEFRRSLEGECAACAAQLGDRVAFAKLRKSHLRLGQALAAGESGIEQDIAFHMAVAQSTGNRFFAHTLAALSEQMNFSIRLVRDLAGRPIVSRKQEVLREHEQILDAIDAGDAAAARDAMRAHIDGGIARLFGR
ncbi:FadR/GntR family transcriptional regulator [Paraburkholderia aromaticivorans]|uniref:FadR/GntR family transcriptional regulator n=1 Tax=Paraburkholderia aromaticivorans TaxID=2026199 RepID=UPI0014561B4B|nr:FCD domain-containing protein [Paraburkholderia aromaticivorans]